MKKYLTIALAFVGIIACNKVENEGPQPVPAIVFDNSFVEAKLRGAIDPSITTATIDKFDAWAFLADTKAVLLDKERVTRTAEGWKYDNVQYWLPSQTYYFGAIAPVDDPNISVSTTGANTYGLGEVTFTNADGSTDLIYASKAVTTSPDVINNAPGKVRLQFAHLLSKVKFTFTNGFATGNTTLKVEDITMTAPKAGKINLAQEDWWTENKWEVTENGLVLDFGDVNGAVALASAQTEECASHRLTIPAGEDREYLISFKLSLYVGTYEEPVYSVTREVRLTGQALKIGKSYNFRTIIGPDNIHPDGPLKAIEFDVIEVKAWEEGIVNALPL